MKRTIEVVTLSVERPDSILTVELGKWHDAWVVLHAEDEDGIHVYLERQEISALQMRADAGEDETGVDV